MDAGGDAHAQEEVEDDPIPNDLDNALVHLLPAIKACGSDPSLPTYLDLAKFEELAGPVLREGAVSESGTGGGTGKDGGGKQRLDERVSGEIQVAFRHCMHEAGLALAGLDVGGARGGKGGRRAAAGPGGAAALPGSEPMAEPMGILSLALAFVANEAGLDKSDDGGGSRSINQVLTALPLLLLEDFMESQGRTACKEFWSAWVEPNSERLSRLVPVNNGRYPLIRLCNKLAQRMSKTHDSSLCGQMHMFLGKALDFFERSAVNVSGSINLDNVTRFEDEEQFRRAMMGFDGEDEASSGTGAAVAAAPAAKGGGDAMEVEVDAPAGAAAAAAAGGGATKLKEGANPQEFAVDYPLYRSFWRLQEYPLQQDKVVKGEEAKATWEALLADVDKILGAFEKNAFSEHDLRLAREKWAADGGDVGGLSSPSSSAAAAAAAKGSAAAAAATTPGKRKRGGGRVAGAAPAPAPAAREVAEGESEEGSPVYFGLKYLTSSRLLRLQLRDPTLRLQVLTQWLILAASLKNKVANAKDSPNSVEDLKPRIELAKRLVKATPPRGEEYLSMLQIVLNRETFWTQWKDVTKCKLALTAAKEEETQREKDKAAGVVARTPSYPNKRPRPSASVAAGERAKYSPLGAGFPLEKMVSKLRAGVPTSQEHLEDQRMCAEDPDTPASELPSASPLYTWRALRLLGRENPANLVGCYDGDLVKAMERLDKAQADAEAAAKVAEEAAAAKMAEEAAAAKAAAVAKAAAAAPTQPTKEEPTVDPPAAAEAAPAAEPVGGDSTAMAVDGEEEGRNVEVKKEAAAASTSGEAAVPAVAVSADASGAADAAAKAASASTAADTTPAGDRADDNGLATDGAVVGGAVVTSTAATDATASKASATPADAPTDPDVNGVAVTEGTTATAAVEGSSGSVVSPPQEETPDGGGGSEKTNAVADSTAPATDAGKEALAEETPAAVTAAAVEKPAPSPARVTRRSSKK